MALNGGISLAGVVGGCAVEVDSARRAHLGAEPVEPATEPSRGVRETLGALTLGAATT